MLFSIERRNNFNDNALHSMHSLRARIFKEKKAWDVSLIADMEIDGYDAFNPYYMIITSSAEQTYVCGCWRILPTTGPNMLAHTFPELLHGSLPPCADDIWELSRFAMEASEKSSFNFSNASAKAISTVVRFAMDQHIRQFVTVTTVGVEKMLRRLGLDLLRFGPPIKIGVEDAVALQINLNETTWGALKQFL